MRHDGGAASGRLVFGVAALLCDEAETVVLQDTDDFSRAEPPSSLSDLGVSHVIAGCLFLTRKSATVENARLAKFSAPKSDKLLGIDEFPPDGSVADGGKRVGRFSLEVKLDRFL